MNDRVVRTDDMKGSKWTALGNALNQLSHPWALQTDADGLVYVADMLNDRIVRFTLP